MKQILEDEGRVWLRGALSEVELQYFEKLMLIESKIGVRLEWSEALRKIAGPYSTLQHVIQGVVQGVKPVRFISFNKTNDINWALPWHQDRVIAVADKIENAKYTNWSRKSGIWHCEPPIDVLKDMSFARIHLDDADETNGCLELALGSHKYGEVVSDHIRAIVEVCPKEVCRAKRGDILLVKALTLHRSGASNSTKSRRVLRIDYASKELPRPLSWKYNLL